MQKLFFILLSFASFVVCADDMESQPFITNIYDKVNKDFSAIPFALSTQQLSFAFGAAGVFKHAGQPQAIALGAGLYSSNKSWMGYVGFHQYTLPHTNNWLFSLEAYKGHYTNGFYYLPGNPDFIEQRPATNSSDKDNYIISVGDERYYRMHMRYILPIAWGSDGALATLRTHDSISWDPSESGVTSLTLIPFWRSQEVRGSNIPNQTSGLMLDASWDNRDNPSDATKGGQSKFKLTRDFGDSHRVSYTKLEFEQSYFYPLSSNSFAKEQVLAFDFYTADTPTWNSKDGRGYHRPPSFFGANLGGFMHQRGFPGRRFYDRSAINYSLEYRLKPQWQPFQDLKIYNVSWWQLALFGEMGRVAPDYNFKTLHEDMKTTVGMGVRLKIEGIVVRTDFAYAGEETQMWVMVNQTY